MSATNPSYIKHLNTFIQVIQKDQRLTANHVSLYLALFSVWNQHFFKNPFQIIREVILQICHIGSFNTYSKCLNELHDFGYIHYSKAKLRGRKSTVSILPLSQVLNCKNDTRTSIDIETSDRKNDTGAVANLRPIINNTNSINNERGNAPPPKKNKPKDLNEVRDFFQQFGHPKTEADKFFHHYEANSWTQGGGVRITNWQAAAQKWILNIHPIQTLKNDKRAKPGNLHINQNKRYSDPL
jgi:hypothetical protein